MYWSKLFIPTLRTEAPLLVRAGYMRGEAYLILGRRSLRKIVQIARQEMDAIGGQELYTPANQDLAHLARELRSYKQLPQIWYQFQTRLESCSFDSPGGTGKAFSRILERCGLPDSVVSEADADPEDALAPEEFHTPDIKTIAELAAFTGLPETSQVKSLAMVADGKPVMALLRGDHQLSETRLARALGAAALRPARPEEIRGWLGADAGSLGPVGVKNMRIVADEALRGRHNMICGANRNDYHLRHVTPGQDFEPAFADIRIEAEIARVRQFSRKHAQALGLHVTSESGQELLPLMARGVLGIGRILESAAARHYDQDGLILPPAIAPFTVILTPVHIADEAQRRAALEIYEAGQAAGLDPLLDDRDERPGVKFKDADLIGVPYRVNLGKKLAQGMVEIVERRSRKITEAPVSEVISFLSTPR